MPTMRSARPERRDDLRVGRKDRHDALRRRGQRHGAIERVAHGDRLGRGGDRAGAQSARRRHNRGQQVRITTVTCSADDELAARHRVAAGAVLEGGLRDARNWSRRDEDRMLVDVEDVVHRGEQLEPLHDLDLAAHVPDPERAPCDRPVELTDLARKQNGSASSVLYHIGPRRMPSTWKFHGISTGAGLAEARADRGLVLVDARGRVGADGRRPRRSRSS